MRSALWFRVPSLVTAGLALGLAGCSVPPRVQSSADAEMRQGVMDTFQYAAGRGEMLTVIMGRPLPMPAETVGQSVTAAMSGSNNGPATTFVTTPTPATRPGYFILVRFDRPIGFPTDRDCLESAQGTASPTPDGGDLRVMMVFCSTDTAMSWVIAKGPRPNSLDDPRFVRVIRSATRSLIPSIDGDLGGRNVSEGTQGFRETAAAG